MSAPSKALSCTARDRAIARRVLWAVVDRYTGRISNAVSTRDVARRLARLSNRLRPNRYTVVLLNVRVQGVRA